MDLRKLKTLIDLVQASGIAEIEINEEGDHVRIVNPSRSSRTGDYRDSAGSSGPGRTCALRSACCPVCHAGLQLPKRHSGNQPHGRHFL